VNSRKTDTQKFASTEVMIASKLSAQVLVACCHRELRTDCRKRLDELASAMLARQSGVCPSLLSATMTSGTPRFFPDSKPILAWLKGNYQGDVARTIGPLSGDQQHELERVVLRRLEVEVVMASFSVHRRKVNHPPHSPQPASPDPHVSWSPRLE